MGWYDSSGNSNPYKLLKVKEYKTPQAVRDFVRTYRNEILMKWMQNGRPVPRSVLEAHFAQLEEFLLKQIDEKAGTQ